jgi:hypothetical protein
LRQVALVRRAQRDPPSGEEVVEATIGKCADLTSAAQSISDFLASALARDGSPEVRVADRYVTTHKAEVIALRARWRRFGLDRIAISTRPREWPQAGEG